MVEHPPVRWGVLGCARIAKKLWRAIKASSNGVIVAVASRDASRAEAFINDCQEHAPFKTRPDAVVGYDELLARADIEAVYIPLPTAIRKEWVIKAAERGKHVLVEKPVAVSFNDAREMVAASIQHAVHLMDGVMFVHSSRMPALRQALGEIGHMRTMHSHFSFRGDESFFSGDIRTAKATEPLGCLGDLGWYNIRMTLFVKDWELPARLRATIHAQSEEGVPFEITAELLFKDGTSATFACSFLGSATQYCTIVGEEATIEVADFVLPVAGMSSSFTIVKQSIGSDALDVVVTREETKVAVTEASHGHRSSQEVKMVEHFAQLINRGPVTTQWAEQMLRTQVVLDSVLASARDGGRWVEPEM